MNIEEYFDIYGKYELVDGFYNVVGNVRLIKDIRKLKIKFGNVSGDFLCHGNNLISLKGCPEYVGGDFWCHGNNLDYLKGCPSYVGGDFRCYNNNDIASLEGCPSYVGGSFLCDIHLRKTKEYKKFKILEKLRN